MERRYAVKAACTVWGTLGGNLPLRGDKAPSFDSIFVGKKHGQRWLWHAIDHGTGAVLAASTGATLAELMARLGHSTAGAALRYQHAAKNRDKVIAEALSNLATKGL